MRPHAIPLRLCVLAIGAALLCAGCSRESNDRPAPAPAAPAAAPAPVAPVAVVAPPAAPPESPPATPAATEPTAATPPFATSPGSVPAVAPAPAPVASAPAAMATAPAPAGPVGFDVTAVPVATPTLGAFPYFSLIDGYEKMTAKNEPGNSAKDFLKDVAFDKYEFFDGTGLLPVEGRLYTVRAKGKTASFHQVQKTYEKLVKDLGGVTVYEGKTSAMKPLKLKYGEGRHRARTLPDSEQMGVYMVRTPDREIWVEAYQAWDDAQNYWLTVVEKKALPMQASVLPAEALKKELDANGRVALYLNFDTDRAVLRSDAPAVLEQVVKLLQGSPELKLSVEGHTDNDGAFSRNQQLSNERAQAVVAGLVARGVAADRLRATGFGQGKPLAENSTDAGKAKNRRVELVRL